MGAYSLVSALESSESNAIPEDRFNKTESGSSPTLGQGVKNASLTKRSNMILVLSQHLKHWGFYHKSTAGTSDRYLSANYLLLLAYQVANV